MNVQSENASMHAWLHVCFPWGNSIYPVTHPHPYVPTPYRTSWGVTPPNQLKCYTLKWIKIFQFCLKIWNMCRLPHLWLGVWFCGLVDGWVFLLTFWYLTAYLKHLSPLQGYFWWFQYHLSTFQKMGGLRNAKFSQWRSDDYPIIGLLLGGQVLGYIMGGFDLHPTHLGAYCRPPKVVYHFFDTFTKILIIEILLQESVHRCNLGCSA